MVARGLALRPAAHYNACMTLRDELERIRAERDWTYGRMAEELLVRESTYRMYVTGHNRAGRKILGGVALAFPHLNVAYYAAQDIADSARSRPGCQETAPDAREGFNKGKDASAGGNGRQSTDSKEVRDGAVVGAGASDGGTGGRVDGAGHEGDKGEVAA